MNRIHTGSPAHSHHCAVKRRMFSVAAAAMVLFAAGGASTGPRTGPFRAPEPQPVFAGAPKGPHRSPAADTSGFAARRPEKRRRQDHGGKNARRETEEHLSRVLMDMRAICRIGRRKGRAGGAAHICGRAIRECGIQLRTSDEHSARISAQANSIGGNFEQAETTVPPTSWRAPAHGPHPARIDRPSCSTPC